MVLYGELLALAVAFLWALSSVIYSQIGQTIPSIELNLLKALIGIGFLLLAVMFSANVITFDSLPSILLLLISGAIGIGFGDTAYIEALKLIGAQRASLIKTLSPPLAVLLALAFLQEIPSLTIVFGIFVTVTGVVIALPKSKFTLHHATQFEGRGYFWGFMASLAEATSIVISRGVLSQTNISPLWSTFLRLLAAALVIIAWRSVFGRRTEKKRILPLSKSIWWKIVLAVFAGTFLGLWSQQAALKLITAGIAQTIFATSPLFVMLIVLILKKETVTLRGGLGAIIALVGVAILFLTG